MTQRQINSLNMFQAVLQYLNDNNSTWSGNTVIAAGVNTFSASVDAIQKNASAQQSSSKQGYTSKKNEDLENLVDLTYKLALRVKNYAISIHDAVLKQAVDFSRHELEDGKETDIVNRCKTLYTTPTALPAPPLLSLRSLLNLLNRQLPPPIPLNRIKLNVMGQAAHTAAPPRR